MAMKYALAALSALSLACALPSTGWAHGATHAQHGGIVQMNGETLFELVRAPNGVLLYVMDEDEPVNAKGMTAKLSVTVAGKRREVPMVAGAANQFVARGLTLRKGASVGVLVVNNASRAQIGTTFIIKK